MLRYDSTDHVYSDVPVHITDLLTQREREIAELVAEGLSNDQIAEPLALTPGTVANQVAHIRPS